MPTDLAKSYDAAAVQAEVAAVWEAERAFHAEPTDPGEPYSIVIPPPNVTAALHLGHALNNTIQDVLIRWKRMAGFNAVWLPGTDHAGIATQTVVEKRVLAEEGKRRTDFSREAFIEKIQAWKDEYEQTILGQLKAMGCSCDFARTAFTMDEPRAKAVREAFFRLFKDGLIYRGKRLVNWDPVTQTALADDEVEMEEVDGFFYYLKYPVVSKDEGGRMKDEADPSSSSFIPPPSSLPHVTVATTRPETMLGDTAVAINPRDPRAEALRGKFVKLPIVDRLIPIVEDEYVVLPDAASDDPKARFATGLLKVTPAHDPNDWEIGQRHGLAVINVMAPDGSISDKHGWSDVTDEAAAFVGLDRDAARAAVVEWFKARGLLEDVKPYRHSVGHSYRSHAAIEPYLSDQWYVAVRKPIPGLPDEGLVEGTEVPANSLAGLALTALMETKAPPRGTGVPPASALSLPCKAEEESGRDARSTALRFVPERYAKTFRDWHENLRDWCISRQLWWGHRIPVWTIGTAADAKLVRIEAEKNGFCQDELMLDDAAGGGKTFVVPQSPLAEDYLIQFLQNAEFEKRLNREERLLARLKLERTHPKPMELQDFESDKDGPIAEQDPDVLDTWFSSALWPMSTLGWPEDTPELRVWNPTAALTTAREIITLWVGRMVMFNRYLLADRGGPAAEIDPDPAELDPASAPAGDPTAPSILGSAESKHGSSQSMRGSTQSKHVETQSNARSTRSKHPSTQYTHPSTQYTHPSTQYTHPSTQYTHPSTQSKHHSDPSEGQTGPAAGPPPFRDVFIHAMIQDGEGRKMSKSLGNGVDPLDIIATHGADAMRFTLAGMVTQTQDVRLPVARDEATGRNTSPKFDLGRNFCNKLWNAGRFVLGQVGSGQWAVGSEEVASTAIDKWILSRLAVTIREVNAALEEYRFDRYATACYDFFWRDFCDWYVEAAKPAMRDPARAAGTARVLATCLDASLRLMHPVVPLVTERLWWALNEAATDRGLPGLDLPPSERCIKAKWPETAAAASLIDEAAEATVTRLQEIIAAVRVVRNEHKVDPKKRVPVSVACGPDVRAEIEASREFIETLAECELRAVGEVSPPADAAKTAAAGCDIYVEGVVDRAAEAQRMERLKTDLTKQIGAMKGRLGNAGYTEKAPPHLVQQTRDQLAAAEAELANLKN